MRIKIILFLILFSSTAWGRTTHYVGETSSGSNDGSSWDNKWEYTSTFQSSTNWCSTSTYPKASPSCDNLIGAGDTVYIDGGTSPGITYTSYLKTFQSGVSGHPITIKINDTDSSHNYKVIIDPNFSTVDIWNKYGIYVGNNYITIDGSVNGLRALLIKDSYEQGIQVAGKGVTVKYVEITNCGASGSSTPAGFGFDPSTTPTATDPMELSYSYIHDQVERTSNSQMNIRVSMGSASLASGYGRVLIHHNTLKNASQDHIESALGGVDIYNNEIYNEPLQIPVGYDGIHMMAEYTRIYNNSFHGLYETGYIYLQYTAGVVGQIAGHTVVMNNLFFDNNNVTGSYGIVQSFYVQPGDRGSKTIDGLADIYIINNVFDTINGAINIIPDGETTWDSNIDSSSTISNYYVVNNIFKSSTSFVLAVSNLGNGTVTTGSWGSSANIIIDYNNVFAGSGITTHYYNNILKTYPTEWRNACSCSTNDQANLDPLFRTGIYNIESNSPSRDTGIAVSYAHLPTTTDYIGTTRPTGTYWDIGAYEYGAGGGGSGLTISGGVTIR